MKKLAPAALSIALILTAASTATAQQTAASPGAGMPHAGSASGHSQVRHLVYRFGYNTKATKEGRSTGTTTIDFVGHAPDGGITITATDEWWNAVNPRQSYTCELYPNGGVTCAKPPFALSPIQLAIVPLLGRQYFAALGSGSNSSWTQTYNVRATFFPSAGGGFAGQVYTWNSVFNLNGKGLLSAGSPLLVVQAKGAMKQHGGRHITTNENANIAFDPRIQVPALVNAEFTFVPTMSTNRYTVELKLIKVSPQ